VVGIVIAHILLVRTHGVVPPFVIEGSEPASVASTDGAPVGVATTDGEVSS
jgi:hypothetical protein